LENFHKLHHDHAVHMSLLKWSQFFYSAWNTKYF